MWGTVVLRACGVILLAPASLLAVSALTIRADSEEELSWLRRADTAIGLLFAVAFLLTRPSGPPAGIRTGRVRTVVGAVLVWAATGGPLVLVHESVARARLAAPRTLLTLSRVMMVRSALGEYAKDYGSFPPEARGLSALCDDPGPRNRSGPYLDPKLLTDAWGNAIRYGIRDGQPRAWSCGPDGLSGTDDDIASDR